MSMSMGMGMGMSMGMGMGMTAQGAFAAALLTDVAACPPGLATWNGSDPGRRFAVYRNNVIVGLIDALADTFPVTQALVGEDFFRAMARLFARAQPPRSPVLAWYGDGFPDFIAAFPPAGGLPYLADVARLERLRVECYHAADATPLPRAQIAGLLADAAALPRARFGLHPALRVLRSAHPVVALWAAHRPEAAAGALGGIDLAAGEAALLLRPALDVEIVRVEPDAAVFIDQLRQGCGLGEAAEAATRAAIGAATSAGEGEGEGEATRAAVAFDLAATLGLLIQGGAITHVGL